MMGNPIQLFSVTGLFYLPFFLLGYMKGNVILLMALVFKGPRWIFNRKTRNLRPACMEDTQLGTHKFVTVKDITLHVVESGDPKNPLMLFLHGFPECWYSWRHQIRAFNKEYHCVSFDMRGAGESDAPLSKKFYGLDQLTGDIHELLRVMGHKSCILVGHDWGGMIGWDFASRYPEMVDKLVVVNAAHPHKFSELFQSYFLPQLWRSWYVFFFQLPYLPELLLSMGDYTLLDKQCMKGPATKEDIEAFKFALSRPGRVTTFLNYYRNAAHQFFQGTSLVRNAPTLLIWSTAHYALHNKLVDGTERFAPKLTIERVEKGDMLVHQEQPDLVNGLMKKYLAE
ncbi:epoxide hydrolase 4-like [Strongylocentrotus purpuratus]|uniref:AB hydrolase-1 domain-containing protein n=1 Tax=Strongylocentrotus purpuratus TaxID=7668 RepID=A0A7M7LVJ0_STRPU|nr:epoxide hydrolase 4-like [Strongylocentrotus purpuratus]|eukprot:XP_011661314.1 PREDICTED: epoxide hydrolase 4-like isoform X1 [Strongylocentrotus purpuratus]